jgi:hypothetical protein
MISCVPETRVLFLVALTFELQFAFQVRAKFTLWPPLPIPQASTVLHLICRQRLSAIFCFKITLGHVCRQHEVTSASISLTVEENLKVHSGECSGKLKVRKFWGAPRTWDCELESVSEKNFSGIIGQDPSVSETSRLEVDVFWISLFDCKYSINTL